MEVSVQLHVLVYLTPPQQGFIAGLDAFDKSIFVAPSRSPIDSLDFQSIANWGHTL